MLIHQCSTNTSDYYMPDEDTLLVCIGLKLYNILASNVLSPKVHNIAVDIVHFREIFFSKLCFGLKNVLTKKKCTKESAQYRGRYCALSRNIFFKILFWPKKRFDQKKKSLILFIVFVLFLQISRKNLIVSQPSPAYNNRVIGVVSKNMAFVQYRVGAPKVAPTRYWTHAIFFDTTPITHNYSSAV